MAGISSDIGQAQQKATALRSASETLSTSASVNKDTQTTVIGNQSAHEAIDSLSSAAQRVASAVNSASGSIQSVAQNFQAIDQSGKNLFRRDL
ncbi:TIGR04197 family type VII secretion effector [Enterococcus sp. AZ109]|uniref:TIGR04197 family type VII secretion effector n=1 Tax=Enterococcus sp. AZ109 TaxID=2774634 RepID=UPI003F2822DA